VKVEGQGRDHHRNRGNDQGGQEQTPLEAQVVVGGSFRSLGGWISCHLWQNLALTVHRFG
jgi:hypothetical protein